MKAAVYYGPGDILVEDYPEPTPAADNLVVQVNCCAICGTDLKLSTIWNPRCRPPRVIGHEMVGTVVHVGAQVHGYSVGERVTLATTLGCGDCVFCERGLENLCPNAQCISYDYDGAFAEFLAVPPRALAGGNVIKVPSSVPDEAAALSEPLSCAINAQELANLRPNDDVVILGGGPLAALHAELAKARGVAQVMVVGRSEPRLTLMRRLRDVIVIDGGREDALAVVKDRTAGLGASVVIVCAPQRQTMERAVTYARKGGAVSFFSSLPKGESDITVDNRLIHYGELRLVGASDSRPEHVARAVHLLEQHRIDVAAVVTHRLALAELHQGLELMKQRACLKVMVYPKGLTS